MHCPNCGHQNPIATKFCTNCGHNLSQFAPAPAQKKGIADYLIIGFLVIAFGTIVLQRIIQFMVPEWYEGAFKYILGFIWVISNLSYLLLAFAIGNKNLKIVGIIVTVILVLFLVVQNIQFMLG